MQRRKTTLILILGLLMFQASWTFGARIKDLADLQGVRDNQLVGYGLVVGLNDTGDSSNNGITIQTVANMMEHLGMNLDRDALDVANVAAVMVTAKLPPFAKTGTKIDVLVSSLGDAESLSGGTLLRTPLLGPDEKVYVVAQGPVIIGGVSLGGEAAQVQKNHPTVGRLPDGGLVEREVPTTFTRDNRFVLHLRQADFTTITRMEKVVNSNFNEKIAKAKDSKSLEVTLPETFASRPVQFLASLEKLEVQPDSKARIVINERTGTIVMGARVRLSTVAVAHGNIKLTIKESAAVSQPGPFNRGGETIAVPDTELDFEEEDARFMVMEKGVSIGDVANALNAIGVTPRDVITIFQAIKAAGALQAELVIL